MCSTCRNAVPWISAGLLNLTRSFESMPLGCSTEKVVVLRSRLWPLSLMSTMVASLFQDLMRETKKFFSIMSRALNPGAGLVACAGTLAKDTIKEHVRAALALQRALTDITTPAAVTCHLQLPSVRWRTTARIVRRR